MQQNTYWSFLQGYKGVQGGAAPPWCANRMLFQNFSYFIKGCKSKFKKLKLTSLVHRAWKEVYTGYLGFLIGWEKGG